MKISRTIPAFLCVGLMIPAVTARAADLAFAGFGPSSDQGQSAVAAPNTSGQSQIQLSNALAPSDFASPAQSANVSFSPATGAVSGPVGQINGGIAQSRLMATQGGNPVLQVLDGDTIMLEASGGNQFDPLTGAYLPTSGVTQYTTGSSNQFTFGTGPGYYSADPPTVVADGPEPSSLILLGTGVLGMAGLLRRRIFARRA